MRCVRTVFVAWLLLVACSFVAVANAAAFALEPVPPRTAHVVDAVNFLFPKDRTALEAKLAALESSDNRQVDVLIVKTTGDEAADDYARRALDTWQRDGQASRDAVLIMIATEEWKRSIVAGGSLRDRIAPEMAHRILYDHMAPDFIRGDFGGGLARGADLVVRVADGGTLPPPPKPEGSFASSLWDAISPPPFEFPRWMGMIVGLPFVFLVVSGLLSWKAALLRAAVTSAVIGVFLLLLGSGWLFALLLAAVAFYPAMLNQSDGPEPDMWKDDGRSSDVPWGSIAWSVFKLAGSSLMSSGGGGRGFSGGGGGFSGGGASGSW